jgi:hypothetical protein
MHGSKPLTGCLQGCYGACRGGVMQHTGYELPRIPIPRTSVNRVLGREQGLPCCYIPKLGVVAQLFQSKPQAPLHGAQREAEALCYLHVRQIREVS